MPDLLFTNTSDANDTIERLNQTLPYELTTADGATAGATYSVTVFDEAAGTITIPSSVVAPTVSSPIADQPGLTENGTNFTVDLATVFTNGGGTNSYDLVAAVTGVSLSGSNLTIDLSATGVVSGVTVQPRATNSAGNVADSFTFTVSAAAAGTLDVSSIGFFEENTNIANPSFSVDLTGFAAGDLIEIAVAGLFTPTAISMAGTSILANLIHSNTVGGTAYRRVRIYEYVMPGAGGAATTLDITFESPQTLCYVAIAGVKDGVRGAASADDAGGANSANTAAETISNTVTSAGANNAILTFVTGHSENFDGTETMTNTTTISSDQGVDLGGLIAVVEDVAVGAYTVSYDGAPLAGSDDHAVIASIAFTEAV